MVYDADGKTQRQIKLLEILIGDQELNRIIDRSEVKPEEPGEIGEHEIYQGLKAEIPHKIAFDRQFRCAKSELLKSLLSSAGLLNLQTCDCSVDTLVGTEKLGDFVTCFKSNRKRIDSELGLDMRRDIDRKPVQQLGEVLALIGMKLVLREEFREKKVKYRFYGIDLDGLIDLLEVITRREEARLEREEFKRQRAADQEEWERQALANGDNSSSIVYSKDQAELSPKSLLAKHIKSNKARQPQLKKTVDGSTDARMLRHDSPRPRFDLSNSPFTAW